MLLGEKKKPKRFLGYATFYVRNKILKENKQAFSHLCKKKKIGKIHQSLRRLVICRGQMGKGWKGGEMGIATEMRMSV